MRISVLWVDSYPECAVKENATDTLSERTISATTKELSCKVNYTGHREPVLQWRYMYDNRSKLNQMFGLKGREVHSTLIVDSEAVENICGFVCEIDKRNRNSDESLRCFPSNGEQIHVGLHVLRFNIQLT